MSTSDLRRPALVCERAHNRQIHLALSSTTTVFLMATRLEAAIPEKSFMAICHSPAFSQAPVVSSASIDVRLHVDNFSCQAYPIEALMAALLVMTSVCSCTAKASSSSSSACCHSPAFSMAEMQVL